MERGVGVLAFRPRSLRRNLSLSVFLFLFRQEPLTKRKSTTGGDWRLRIGVADVDYEVLKGSAIDAHAAAQATTVYTGAVIFPMIPTELSAGATSLFEGANRKAVVVEMGYLPTVLGARDRLPELEHVLVVTGPPVPPGTRSFEEALSGAGAPDASRAERGEDDLALIQYTSGTTAHPKGARLLTVD